MTLAELTTRPDASVAVRRAGWSLLVGSAAGLGAGLALAWAPAALVGWSAAAATFLVWVWATVIGRDGNDTRRLATREDSSVALADIVIVAAAIACLGAVALTLLDAARSHGAAKAGLISVAVVSVLLSWAALHTVFTLRYARLYYAAPEGGVDFNEHDRPSYADFAYMAFTIGMTFQVSDTDLTSKAVRRGALHHALLSYLFGAVIVALMINVVSGLLH